MGVGKTHFLQSVGMEVELIHGCTVHVLAANYFERAEPWQPWQALFSRLLGLPPTLEPHGRREACIEARATPKASTAQAATRGGALFTSSDSVTARDRSRLRRCASRASPKSAYLSGKCQGHQGDMFRQ